MASSGLQKAQILKRNLPPLSVFPDNSIGYYARYRIISEDRNRISHWSPVYAVRTSPVVEVTSLLSFVDGVLRLVWGDEEDRPSYDIFVAWGADIKKIELTSTAVIVETQNPAAFVIDEKVAVSGISGTFSGLNGEHTVTGIAGEFVTLEKPSGLGVEPATNVDGVMFRSTHDYHGTSSVHNYSFLTNLNFDIVKCYVQVESIVKERQSALTISTSNVVPIQ